MVEGTIECMRMFHFKKVFRLMKGQTSVGGAPGLVRKVLGEEEKVKVEAEGEERQESVANQLK